MKGKICRYSKRFALLGAAAILAAGCSASADTGADTANGFLGVIPWSHAHPILVNFTAGLVPVSFVSELLGRALKKGSFGFAAWWTVLYAALLTPATALTGWFWRSSLPPDILPADLIETHMYLGILLAAALAGLAVWRGIIFFKDGRPGIGYLAFCGATVCALVYQGNLGGKMVFG